jgi:hypothetical protein
MQRVVCLSLCLACSFQPILPAQEFVPPGAAEAEKTPPPYLIVARVVDTTGTPIEGAGLAIHYGSLDSFDAGTTRTKPHSKTDAAGRLSALVKRVEGQATSFLLSAKGKVCVQLMPRTTNTKVGGNEVAKADLGTIILRDGVDIRGLIRSKGGKPLSGARVQATGVLSRMLNNRQRRSSTYVREYSHAVSDEKGIVRLYGLPKYGVSVRVTADGYYARSIPYLNRHVPLVATLQRGGKIIGQIRGLDGKPVSGVRLRTYSERPANMVTVTTGEDGSFSLDVPSPGRYRISYYARLGGAARYTYLWSKILKGPQPGLILSFEEGDEDEEPKRAQVGKAGRPEIGKDKARKRGLVVKVIDKKTGIAIREVRAVVMWYAPGMWASNPGYLERQIHSAAKMKTDEQGRITLAKPGQGQPTTGRLLVAADGYAWRIVKDVEWDEDTKSNKLTVKLDVELVLAGVVKDAQGAPVAGAKVFVTSNPLVLRNYVPPPMRRRLDGQHGQITTNDKGEFRFGGLAGGKQHVYFSHPKFADADPVEIELKPTESRTNLTMTLPKGATIFGKLKGATPKLGWRVRIQRLEVQGQRFSSYSTLSLDQSSEIVPVQDDGSFVIEGLCRANYNLTLVMPGGEDQIEVPIEPLRVRSKDVRREFDISEEMPGRIEGKVVIRGASLPPGRLLLLAVKRGQVLTHYSNGPNLMGHPIVVGAAGKFSMDVPEGKYYLQLVDLKTAVTLYQGRDLITVKATETVKADLAVDLAPVTVKLVPEKEGQHISISRIEVRVSHPPMPGDQRGRMMFGGSDRYRGIGVEIEPGTTEVVLVLPCISTKLLARSDAHNLDPKRSQYNFPAQGEVELEPETAKSNRVEISVAEPEIDVTNNRRSPRP